MRDRIVCCVTFTTSTHSRQFSLLAGKALTVCRQCTRRDSRRQPHSLPDTSLLLYSLQVLFWPLCPAVQWKDKEVVLVVLVVLPSSTRFQYSSLLFAKSRRRQYLGCWHEKIIEQDKDNLAIFSNSSSVSECILKSLLSRERRKCWNGWNQSQSSFLSASFSTQIWAKRERQRISKQS